MDTALTTQVGMAKLSRISTRGPIIADISGPK